MAEYPGAPTPLTIADWTLDELNALTKHERARRGEAAKSAKQQQGRSR